MQSPEKCIEGLTTKAKIQRNSRGSVVIQNESEVPDEFKYFTFDFSKRFPILDRETFLFLASFALGRVLEDDELITEEDSKRLGEYFSLSVSKSDLEKRLKAGDQIPGVEYRVGHHLRFDAGKVKIKAPKE